MTKPFLQRHLKNGDIEAKRFLFLSPQKDWKVLIQKNFTDSKTNILHTVLKWWSEKHSSENLEVSR